MKWGGIKSPPHPNTYFNWGRNLLQQLLHQLRWQPRSKWLTLRECYLLYMGDFPRGGEWLLKNVPIFFYGKIQTSINTSFDGLQPTCRYQLRVNIGPHHTNLGHAFVELVNTWLTWQNLSNSLKKKKKNLFFCGYCTPFMSKICQIWDHFFPLLLLKDSKYLKKFGHWTLGSGLRFEHVCSKSA